MSGRFYVTVGGDRAATFARVLGSADVPVLSPMPELANLPGRPATWVYLLDLSRVTADQRARLVAHLARTFGYPPAEVERDLDAEGMPILAEGCWVWAAGGAGPECDETASGPKEAG